MWTKIIGLFVEFSFNLNIVQFLHVHVSWTKMIVLLGIILHNLFWFVLHEVIPILWSGSRVLQVSHVDSDKAGWVGYFFPFLVDFFSSISSFNIELIEN